jgi:hypothetical protein
MCGNCYTLSPWRVSPFRYFTIIVRSGCFALISVSYCHLQVNAWAALLFESLYFHGPESSFVGKDIPEIVTTVSSLI